MNIRRAKAKKYFVSVAYFKGESLSSILEKMKGSTAYLYI
jgi:hypothetical protein